MTSSVLFIISCWENAMSFSYKVRRLPLWESKFTKSQFYIGQIDASKGRIQDGLAASVVDTSRVPQSVPEA